jgi:hypothetical protein
MKRSIPLVLILLAAGGAVFAQAPDREAFQRQTETISGSLALIDGRIALRSGTSTYYVAGLRRLIGFVDGLKEGAAVNLEGFSRALPGGSDYRIFLVTKLTLNGKDYELPPPRRPGFAGHRFHSERPDFGSPGRPMWGPHHFFGRPGENPRPKRWGR